MQPNTKKHTVLPVSDGIQGVTGKPEVGNGEKTCPAVWGVQKNDCPIWMGRSDSGFSTPSLEIKTTPPSIKDQQWDIRQEKQKVI